jgi:cysteinyl-tRNA synthetase
MRVYNTLSNKVEEFIPITEGKVNMYVCGPTVYSYAHVGNMRPVIFFDTVYRYLKYLGYEVNYASNFTDVDDKIIKSAIELHTTEKEITEKFIKIYLEDVRGFNCLDIDFRPKVTETIPEIIDFISLLLEKEYAYKSGNDVYFRVSKVKNYGSLSKQDIDSLDYGNRITVDENKESPFDFVLWKLTEDGIKWDAPFGTGRPGWHTECVVMINKIFGGKIDIHGGGVDLKFPHHENEMAQSNAAWEHNLASYWMHNGHIMVNGEKMSKSLNNFILAHELREKYSSNVIRIGMLKTHYRLPLDLTDVLFVESKTIDDKVSNALKQAKLYIDLNNLNYKPIVKDEILSSYMDDDFNTSNVVTYLLDLTKEINNSIRNNKEDVSILFSKILTICYVLGLDYKLIDLTEEDKNTYNSWLKFREEKNFAKADEVRDILQSKGIL